MVMILSNIIILGTIGNTRFLSQNLKFQHFSKVKDSSEAQAKLLVVNLCKIRKQVM